MTPPKTHHELPFYKLKLPSRMAEGKFASNGIPQKIPM